MAETATDTSTSDRVRDPSDFGEVAKSVAPTPPAPPAAPPADPRTAVNQRIEQSMRDEAAAVNPQLQKAKEMGERLIAEAEARRKPVEQADQSVRTTQGQQPSLGLRPFLSTVKGEAPETAIQKFIQALGIFGAAIGSSAKGDARAGLAALTGAMQGWQQGDRERADRAFADWRQKMDAALEAAQSERNSYREWFASGKFSLDQAFKGAQMEAMMRGNSRMADLFEKGNMDQTMQEMFQMQKHHDDVEMKMATLALAHEDKKMHDDTLRFIASQKAAEKATKDQQVADAYQPEDIALMGQQLATTGKLPAGLGRSGAQAIVRAKIFSAARKWATDHGIDPASLPAIQAEVNGLKQGIATLDRQQALQQGYMRSFELHVDQMVELGKRVDRGKSPIYNRWLLWTRGQAEGDPGVLAFEALARQVGAEAAKVASPTGQGDAETRAEFRKSFAPTSGQPALEEIAKQEKQAARSKIAGARAQREAMVEEMNGLLGAEKKEPKPTAGGAESKSYTLPDGTKVTVK